MEREIFNPTGHENEIVNGLTELKDLHKNILSETKIDLLKIEEIIKDEEEEINIQKSKIQKLKTGVRLDAESAEIELSDAEEFLKLLEEDLKESLGLRTKLVNLMNETDFSDAEIDVALKKIKNDILKFKESLIKIPKEQYN